MKAIATSHSSLFFSNSSAGSLTSVWSARFIANARDEHQTTSRAVRRQLRNFEQDAQPWQEVAARLALIATMVSAYIAAFWQIGSF